MKLFAPSDGRMTAWCTNSLVASDLHRYSRPYNRTP